jgi:hypothetical protein
MLRWKPYLWAAFFGLLIGFPASAPRACPLELMTTTVAVGGRELTVELAITPESRSCGLSHRSQLAEDRGMLFVFPTPQRLSFWMKDTPVALSIAFIDNAGRILSIQKMTPLKTTTSYQSPAPARYALEVTQGWFEKNSVGVDDLVEFSLPIMLNIR